MEEEVKVNSRIVSWNRDVGIRVRKVGVRRET